MNTELLISLYKVFSPSNGEKRMRRFIKRYVKSLGGNINVRSDNGNLYITKGESDTYPCIVAHMDQVQRNHSKDFECFIHGDIIFGFSAKTMQQQGLGADDKNGIWVALECLRKYDVMKCAFFWGEEIGCQGSEKADMDFFKDVRFCVQCDRKQTTYDLVTNISGELCSEDFIRDCGYEQFGYEISDGMMTDVEQLSELGIGVSCVNMSCGYHHPHTDEEVTNLKELDNCLHFVEYIIEHCTDVYPHEYDYYSYWRGTKLSSDKYFDWYDDDDIYSELVDNDLRQQDYNRMYDLVKENGANASDFELIYNTYHTEFNYDSYFYLCNLHEDVCCEILEELYKEIRNGELEVKTA